MNDLAERQDRYTMASCRYLVRVAQAPGWPAPTGETAESMGEFVEAHRSALHVMKQRNGKGGLVLEIGMLARRWPPDGGIEDEPAFGPLPKVQKASFDAAAAREEPLMREAKEIFVGTWLDEHGNRIEEAQPPVPDLFA